MLEAAGEPAAPPKSRSRRRKKAEVPAGYRVAEVYFERRGGRSIVGNIYKGKVDNVLPGLEAAFVDIGLDKNGFLHVDEIVLPGVEQARRGRGSGPRITDLLAPGQEVVVQVVKDPLKTKGARLSMELTIAGRYMVYAPTGEGIGVSRRLEDAERDRLRKEAKQLDLGGGGAIIRTAAHGAVREDFERELQYLFKLNEVLEKRVRETEAPALVFQEADLSVRVVRDIFSAHFERAVVDDPKQHHRLVSFFARTAPELVDRVELWEEDEPLFEAFGVEPVIEGMLNRRVDLPSGGYLMIDYAEALTVIDVNTGSFTGKGKAARLEDTITKTNLEAAEEVVNQLRLRDIGGIIVIDFIDMARSRNRDAVLKVLRKALDEDRTKTFVVEISPLGLVEMTRQNVTDGVREIRHVLAGHLDQPERRDLDHEGLRAVLVERLAQHLQHCVAVAGAGHVDEVDDDDPADVAQPQLADDLVGGLEVGLGDRVLEPRALALAGERAGVDVDDRERLGVVDDQVAPGGQVHAAREHALDHRVDPVGHEQRLRLLPQLDAVDELGGRAVEERDEPMVLLGVVDH